MSQHLREGTLTVLFTDLEGSTDLRTRIGDEAANDLMQEHAQLIRTELQKHGGAEAKFLGDGFMILFDSAGQALRCAIGIQLAIDHRNREEAGEPIKVRIGLNTGDISRQAEDVYGTAVHAAARICDKAGAGQILISQTVKDLSGYLPDVRIVDRGLTWLKGFPNRWRLFEVLWQDRPEVAPGAGGVRATDAGRHREFPRSPAPMIGRATELKAIRRELEAAHAGALRALALEGEAGIGKTRLLEYTCELADSMEPPFWILRVAADEELRGPFFLFRTLFATPAIETFAEQASALEVLEKARNAISGNGAFLSEGLSPQEQMLRVFDEASQAIRSLARQRPLALLLDDLQWADIDSIRLIRYLVRTSEGVPFFMMFTLRPDVDSSGGASGNLVSDLERMHIAQRLQLRRFTRNETAELLHSLLGGPVAAGALDSVQARAEGVPFFVEEFGRAYREANVLQLLDGSWNMTKVSGPAVPVSVQSLIARRLAQLDPDARELLADAAILGRRFRLADLAAVRSSTGEAEISEWRLADLIEPAIHLGIVSELPESSPYDLTFSHDQIQAALVESQTRQRKRRIHAAIADILASEQEHRPGVLSAMAYHALTAGDDKRGVAWAVKAAQAGLDARAPEESLRIIDIALRAAVSREDRISLLRMRDDNLALLDRGEERLANLAELEALSSAEADFAVEMDVKLRRVSAFRSLGDFEVAAEVASAVRQAASAKPDPRLELEACLEMGQALARSPLGEAYWPLVEVDLDAASEAFERALELAQGLDEKALEAAALRELGVLESGRVKLRVLSDLGSGSRPQQAFTKMLQERYFEKAKTFIGRALHLYEELGDNRGATSSLIAMAYAHVPEPGRRGEAGRIEQVRRLQAGMKRLVTESQRIAEDAQMLYSIHVFARAHVYPDLALERGRDAFEAARTVGDRKLEFLSAGGVGMAHLYLLQTTEARGWFERAKGLLPSIASPVFTRRVQAWMGLLEAAENRVENAMEHFEAAAASALDRGSPAGRCECLALLALEAAKLGAGGGPEWLLERAGAAAEEARAAARTLPGKLAWEAQAWAATALVAYEEKDKRGAAEATRACLAVLEPRFRRELYLDVLWIAAKTLILEGQDEGPDLSREIRENLEVIDRSIVDRKIRELWFSVPMHAELARLADYAPAFKEAEGTDDLAQTDVELLNLLTSGASDREIAETLGAPAESVELQLSNLYKKLGVTTRNEAKQYAVKAGVA